MEIRIEDTELYKILRENIIPEPQAKWMISQAILRGKEEKDGVVAEG